jgi:hypothetical protein
MSGGLGPLQALGVAGSLTIDLVPDGEGTHLVLTYAVGGYFDGGLASLSSPVDEVLGGQMDRLARFAATGSLHPSE